MTEAVSREELYEQVWSEPMLKVAERYEVSSSYMARVCTVMNVPRPAAGYWGKHAVGRAPPQPELPPASPVDQLDWAPGGVLNQLRPQRLQMRVRRPKIVDVIPAIEERAKNPTHQILIGARQILDGAKEVDGYLKPTKRLMVDVLTTKMGVERVLTTAQALFDELERRSYPVTFASSDGIMTRVEIDEREDPPTHSRYPVPWKPNRGTVAHFGTIAIGLALVESSKKVEVAYVKGKYVPVSELRDRKGGIRMLAGTWTTQKYVPTGFIRLVAYAPYSDVIWQKTWQENASRALAADAPKIVREIEKEIPTIEGLVEAAKERQRISHEKWNAQRLAWKEEERLKKLAEQRKNRVEELKRIFADWEADERVRAFFDAMTVRAAEAEPELQPLLKEKLALAQSILLPDDVFRRFSAWEHPPFSSADDSGSEAAAEEKASARTMLFGNGGA